MGVRADAGLWNPELFANKFLRLEHGAAFDSSEGRQPQKTALLCMAVKIRQHFLGVFCEVNP